MVKVLPLNTAIPVKNNDDTYNYLYGITCGLCPYNIHYCVFY